MNVFGLHFVICIRLTKTVMPFEDVVFQRSCEITGLFQRLRMGLSLQDIYSNFAWCCNPITFYTYITSAEPKYWDIAHVVAYATNPPKESCTDEYLFMLLCPVLMDPHKFMTSLKQCFNTKNIYINELCIVRHNIIVILQSWIVNHQEDFDEALIRDLYSFVSPILSHNRLVRSKFPTVA
jgi:hypothetical protein